MKKLKQIKKKLSLIGNPITLKILRGLLSEDFYELSYYSNVFISKKLQIVIKKQYKCSRYDRGNPNFVPSEFYKRWTIQPLCNTRRWRRAWNLLMKGKGYMGKDLHEGNVGMYRNRAVVFDW